MLTQYVKPVAEWAAAALEIFGIAIIVLMALLATLSALHDAWRRAGWREVFSVYRLKLSRGILLGLEFLVGADIISTVAVELDYRSVGVLAIIVLIRTFLSFTLELEISGRWPWPDQMSRPPGERVPVPTPESSARSSPMRLPPASLSLVPISRLSRRVPEGLPVSWSCGMKLPPETALQCVSTKSSICRFASCSLMP